MRMLLVMLTVGVVAFCLNGCSESSEGFNQRMESQLARMQKDVDALKADMAKAPMEVKAKVQPMVTAMEGTMGTIKSQLAASKMMTGEMLTKAQADISKMMDSLKMKYNEAMAAMNK